MLATQTEHLAELEHRYLAPTYKRAPFVLERGDGVCLFDNEGKRYLDLCAGIATVALGHADPEIAQVIADQAHTLGHVSNLYYSVPMIELAQTLCEASFADKVFFTNSGAEANEAGLKLARRHRPGGGYVACEGAFHGRTMGALAVTGQPAKRTPFEPLPGPVTFVPYGDGAALRSAVTGSTASIVLEPVLGEAGVVVPPPGFLAAAREAADAAGALLHLDEVQGCLGRAGAWLSHTVVEPGLQPDVVTLAKGLGGGLPMGAVLARGAAATAFVKGDHGTTFGGNPVVAAAALAVLDVLEKDDLLARATEVGDTLRAGIEGLGHPLVDHVRGVGAWLGIVLTSPVAAAVEAAARDAGFLVNAAVPDAVRLAPPLVLSDAQVSAFLAALPGVLDAVTVPA
jgi:acetylornithine aminotransferase